MGLMQPEANKLSVPGKEKGTTGLEGTSAAFSSGATVGEILVAGDLDSVLGFAQDPSAGVPTRVRSVRRTALTAKSKGRCVRSACSR